MNTWTPKDTAYRPGGLAQPEQEPVGRFAKFTDGIWREVTDGSAGVPLYTAPPPCPTCEAYRCGFEAGAVAEREACAKVCEGRGMLKGGEVFAARIRARGTT